LPFFVKLLSIKITYWQSPRARKISRGV
jgi:hypothetical protein